MLPDRGCDPERVFELADGGLTPQERRQAHSHLEDCPECRELYEREMELSSKLGSCDFSGLGSDLGACDVSRRVAMALPTRPLKARFLWAVLSVGLLAVALAALEIGGVDPAAVGMGVVGTFWGLVSGGADVVRAFFPAAAPTVLVALGIGAVADLLIAAAVFAAARRAKRA